MTKISNWLHSRSTLSARVSASFEMNFLNFLIQPNFSTHYDIFDADIVHLKKDSLYACTKITNKM
jgi:hypothetical protein